MTSAKVVRLHSSCISGIVNRTKTLSLESLSNKDPMGQSNNREQAVVRYISSILLGEIIAESEVTDVHSFEYILSVGCYSILGIKRIERAWERV